MATVENDSQRRRQVVIWLGAVCLLVCLIVVVGGITRLTDSGLSMVDWKPLLGVIPPLSEADWQQKFSSYQQFPEYQLLNKEMTLAEFKLIFFWEYLHRILGRLIGIVFLLPFIFFSLRGYFNKTLNVKLLIGLLLGGLQGLMGWYMVKSGLVDLPHVSHYRLAAHLSLAFIIFAFLLWLILDLQAANDRGKRPASRYLGFSYLITAVVALQVIVGAFVAGRNAGHGFNTFPKMGEQWLPNGLFQATPIWLNFLENNTTIQFTHRGLAWGIFLLIAVLWAITRKDKVLTKQRRAINLLMILLLMQFLLGVATLIYVVPTTLAVLHQFGALLLFASAIIVNHSLRPSK